MEVKNKNNIRVILYILLLLVVFSIIFFIFKNEISNEKLEKNFKLKVVYDKNKGEIGKDILEDIQIKVHSEQIKVGWY